ncbi:MAG: sigma 54-interacting transcriptional regulator [Lachnospiraceae bacterium]|nr:sigma 54-interacting transcriptional regulator [Lachnospiraceae bacterium]
MIKLVFILPYAELFHDVKNAFLQLERPDVSYEILTVTDSEEDLVGKLQGDAVIARGFASHFFQSRKPSNMINVEIATSGVDIILAAQECLNLYHKKNIAILGTKTIIDSCHHLETLFKGIHFQYYLIKQRSDAYACIQTAVTDGAEAVIGGRTVCRAAKQINLPSVLIKTGPEAISKSLGIAIRLVEETRKEHMQYDRISKIIQYSYSGILSTNANGIINSINEKACSIFHTSLQESIGQPFTNLLPASNIVKLIHNNQTRIDEICKTRYGMLTVTYVPIIHDSECNGCVITCMEANELQKTEAKLRKKILDRGFIAKYCFDDIIHHDHSMDLVIEKAKRFSRNESNVFIHGETGVGKELFAQSIHNASRRKNGPFVAINCAALPEQLLESELFGYVEGAFTGASKNGKIGMFEAAHHGTIFLDEIGDMSLKLQGRLLRVLQEKEIVRLGGDHVIPIDVRVISATNRDLNHECELGNFRNDLMYRLDVLHIVVPPLRKRKQDIVPLSLTFIEEICRQEGQAAFSHIEPEAQTMLQSYAWDGNVRQLYNIIQRICVLCEDNTITKELVAEALELHTSATQMPVDVSAEPSVPSDISFSDLSEQEIISHALEFNHFNRGKTAEVLGMDRSTLWRKMKKYNLL